MATDPTGIDGWCPDCRIALEDPQHPSWHAIIVWNSDVFEGARRQKQKEFDRRLGIEKPKPKRKKREKRYVPLPGEVTGP